MEQLFLLSQSAFHISLIVFRSIDPTRRFYFILDIHRQFPAIRQAISRHIVIRNTCKRSACITLNLPRCQKLSPFDRSFPSCYILFHKPIKSGSLTVTIAAVQCSNTKPSIRVGRSFEKSSKWDIKAFFALIGLGLNGEGGGGGGGTGPGSGFGPGLEPVFLVLVLYS